MIYRDWGKVFFLCRSFDRTLGNNSHKTKSFILTRNLFCVTSTTRDRLTTLRRSVSLGEVQLRETSLKPLQHNRHYMETRGLRGGIKWCPPLCQEACASRTTKRKKLADLRTANLRLWRNCWLTTRANAGWLRNPFSILLNQITAGF